MDPRDEENRRLLEQLAAEGDPEAQRLLADLTPAAAPATPHPADAGERSRIEAEARQFHQAARADEQAARAAGRESTYVRSPGPQEPDSDMIERLLQGQRGVPAPAAPPAPDLGPVADEDFISRLAAPRPAPAAVRAPAPPSPYPAPAAAGPSAAERLRSAQGRADLYETLGLLGESLNRGFGSPSAAPVLEQMTRSARRPVENVQQQLELEQREKDQERQAGTQRLAQQRADSEHSRVANMRDPASAESRAAQDAFLPVSSRFGYSEESVRSMSAETINRIMPGAIAATAAGGRQERGIEARTAAREDTQEFQAGQQRERLVSAADLVRLRDELRQARRAARGGGPGAQVAADRVAELTDIANIASRLQDPTQAVSDEERARYMQFQAQANTGTRQALSQIVGGGRGAAAQQNRDVGRQQAVADRLAKAKIPQMRVYHRRAQQALAQASDADVRQAVVAMSTGVVPSDAGGFSQALMQFVTPLRHSYFGASLTDNERADFRAFVGNRPVDAIDPRAARARLRQFLMSTNEALSAEENNIRRGNVVLSARGLPESQPADQGNPERARRIEERFRQLAAQRGVGP